MPYRILSIAPSSFFADYGCHVRIYQEARALGRLGHEVTICTYHNGRNPPPAPGVRIARMPRVPCQSDIPAACRLNVWPTRWTQPFFIPKTALRWPGCVNRWAYQKAVTW